MPGLSEWSQEGFTWLKRGYECLQPMPWYKRWLFPSSLSSALNRYSLEEPTLEQAWAVSNAFFNDVWFFQRWFFSFLTEFPSLNSGEKLCTLYSTGLLDGESGPDNFNAVMGHIDSFGMMRALLMLNSAGLLAGEQKQSNFDDLINYSAILLGLTTRDIWTQIPSYRLTADRFCDMVAIAEEYRQTPIAGVEALRAYAEQFLLNASNGGNVAGDVIPFKLNLNNIELTSFASLRTHSFDFFPSLERIIIDGNREAERLKQSFLEMPQRRTYMEQLYEGQGNLLADIRRFGIFEREFQFGPAFWSRQADFTPPTPREFNYSQSTHTTSVHKSVSESAARLLKRYQTEITPIKLDTVINVMGNAINATPGDSMDVVAAKRGFHRITAANFSHEDEVSHVSVKQLLALFWLAINDDKNRTGTFADAKSQLMQGLYEVQRGYNLSDVGVDDACEADSLICNGGTFNKIIEKLIGVHPDVDVLFITTEGASSKLPIVVNEIAMTYLQQKTVIELTEIRAQEDVLAFIWKDIFGMVSTSIFAEFGSLYEDGIDSYEFKRFIEVGVIVDLSPAVKAFIQNPTVIVTQTADNPSAFFVAALPDEQLLNSNIPKLG